MVRGKIEMALDFPVKRRDGSIFSVDISATHFELDERQHIFDIFCNITERKKIEEQLIQSQKMEAIGILTGGVAHDFNNMLSMILGYTELILFNMNTKDPLHANLQEILKAAQHYTAITRQLLGFARK